MMMTNTDAEGNSDVTVTQDDFTQLWIGSVVMITSYMLD